MPHLHGKSKVSSTTPTSNSKSVQETPARFFGERSTLLGAVEFQQALLWSA